LELEINYLINSKDELSWSGRLFLTWSAALHGYTLDRPGEHEWCAIQNSSVSATGLPV